jgi:hypothetical protein
MKWIACELHSHTFHSDGRQTLTELAAGAKALGFDCIALTDHNTMTGLIGKEAVEQEIGIAIIPGMEWTTFHGHMVTIGAEDFVDWRRVGIHDIDFGIERVHSHGGIAGIAHPFRMGGPLCTGCFWEFVIEDWNKLDYIEVWSETFNSIKNDNARAFQLWTDKLNEGYRIAATSGRDWHVQAPLNVPVSVTYLRLEQGNAPVTEKAIRALAAGRASVTIGPLLTMNAVLEGVVYEIGDAVPQSSIKKDCTIEVFADFTARQGFWELPEQLLSLQLVGNSGILGEHTLSPGNPACRFDISRDGISWVRAELWGTVQRGRERVAFTNAIYFD